MSDLAAQITSLMALGPFAAVAAATGFTFSMTALGASFVYFIRDTHNQFIGLCRRRDDCREYLVTVNSRD